MNKKLMDLMTAREAANDEIWEITDKLREKIENNFDGNVFVETINIWPDDGLEFQGHYQHNDSPWSETISWEEWEKFNEN
jgi:hypothetical protein